MYASEITLFLMFVVMLYMAEQYRKVNVLHAIFLVLIPIFVVNNWNDMHIWYSLFIMITDIVVNIAYLVVELQSKKK